MHSIKWRCFRWPLVTPYPPNHPNFCIFRRPLYLRSFTCASGITFVSTHHRRHVASETVFKQDSTNPNSDSLIECTFCWIWSSIGSISGVFGRCKLACIIHVLDNKSTKWRWGLTVYVHDITVRWRSVQQCAFKCHLQRLLPDDFSWRAERYGRFCVRQRRAVYRR